jgi:hypothetical protein
VKFDALVTDKLIEPPLQITPPPVAFTEGVHPAFSVTVAFAVELQPCPFVTVTEYDPAPTVILCVVAPVDQAYTIPEGCAVNVVVPPVLTVVFPFIDALTEEVVTLTGDDVTDPQPPEVITE